nr:MAG TPA: hypothetical protein [Caudoviricetes sp.]
MKKRKVNYPGRSINTAIRACIKPFPDSTFS